MQAAQPGTPLVETVDSALTARFSWDYRDAADDRVSALYQRAKARGWDAARDLPWDTAVDQEALARQDAARRSGLAGADLHGTAFAKWSAGNWLEFAVESQNWTLSQFLHGEQGALLAAGRLIETSPSLQAKMYAGIQAADEARHVEAFSRYLGTKLSGSYPVNTHLRSFMFDLLADSRWDITFLGMQIMIEGLALAAFGILYQTTTEPLLRTLLKLARADEARHVAFGITELQPCYPELTESEISERQEFALEAAVRLRDRLQRQEVWDRLGVPFADAREVLSVSPAHRAFQRSLFVKVLGNCERLGLLDYRGGWLRRKLAIYGFLAAAATIRKAIPADGTSLMESAQAQQSANPAASRPSAAEDGGPLDMIRTLFPTGEIFAVSDDGELGREAARCGMVFVALDQVTQVPDGANVIVLLRRNLVTVQIRKAFRRHRALVVPIASFDTGSLPAVYTLRMLLRTDYAAAARRSRDWAAQLAGNRDPLVFRSRDGAGDEPRTHLTCTLADKLTADAWLTPEIQPGQWVSVGAYCEISLTAPSATNWTGAFTLDGTVVASGALVARDPRYDDAGDARIKRAAGLREELAGHPRIIIRLAGGKAVAITAGGTDYTDAVRDVTNPDYDLHALELGIGTNLALRPHVDWRFNSQLNEGAGPVHIGFGEGATGAHMDFIVADAEHSFEPAAA